jgi:hypothetical protein
MKSILFRFQYFPPPLSNINILTLKQYHPKYKKKDMLVGSKANQHRKESSLIQEESLKITITESLGFSTKA